MATIDPRRQKPTELCRLLNSTPLGEVISERQLHRHRTRAGYRIGDGKTVDLFRYVAWLVSVTNLHSSDITKLLQGLCEKGLLEADGYGRWTNYNLPKGKGAGQEGSNDQTEPDLAQPSSGPLAGISGPLGQRSGAAAGSPSESNQPESGQLLWGDVRENGLGLPAGEEEHLRGIAHAIASKGKASRADVERVIIELCTGRQCSQPCVRNPAFEEWELFDEPINAARNCPHFSVEMETGTGKTYVYLRTIFELHRRYGFAKFIIVVPSVAIREGVLKNLEITAEHFKALYSQEAEHFVYDAKRVNRLRQFATSTTLQILVINIDAFRKNFTGTEAEQKSNVIYKESDKLSGRQPIEFVKAARPIVIIDEPQSVAKLTLSGMHRTNISLPAA